MFYESGLAINVLYTLDDKKKRAVGFKLSDGMEVPPELASRFKFAKQKSKRRHDPRLVLLDQGRVLRRGLRASGVRISRLERGPVASAHPSSWESPMRTPSGPRM